MLIRRSPPPVLLTCSSHTSSHRPDHCPRASIHYDNTPVLQVYNVMHVHNHQPDAVQPLPIPRESISNTPPVATVQPLELSSYTSDGLGVSRGLLCKAVRATLTTLSFDLLDTYVASLSHLSVNTDPSVLSSLPMFEIAIYPYLIAFVIRPSSSPSLPTSTSTSTSTSSSLLVVVVLTHCRLCLLPHMHLRLPLRRLSLITGHGHIPLQSRYMVFVSFPLGYSLVYTVVSILFSPPVRF